MDRRSHHGIMECQWPGPPGHRNGRAGRWAAAAAASHGDGRILSAASLSHGGPGDFY